MSTQVSAFPSVPFSITQPQQNLRLLELPPDLLDLLTSEKKPATLELKSSNPNTSLSSKVVNAQHEYLHLCTREKVWAVRQVSTSNSVYITTPTTFHTIATANADVMDIDDATQPSTTGITAIAQPTSSLELTPVPVTQEIVEQTLQSILPVLKLPDPEGLNSMHSDYTMHSLLNDLPFPKNILSRAIRNLLHTRIHPSPALLLQSYTHFFNTFNAISTTTSTDITNSDLATLDIPSAEAIVSAIALEEGEIFACVVGAILSRFIEINADDDDENDGDNEYIRDKYIIAGKLNGKRLTEWLGRLIVQGAGAEGMPAEKLLEDWKDLVPGDWWGHCDIHSLGGGISIVDGRMRVVDSDNSKGSKEEIGATGSAASSGKRKWHERFGKERNKR